MERQPREGIGRSPTDAAGAGTERRLAAWRQAVTGNVLNLGLVSLFTDLSSEMMNPLLPVFISGLLAPGPDVAARTALFVGLLEGIAETTSSLLKIAAGSWSDRLGRRKTLVAFGYGFSSLCRPLMAIAQSAWHAVALKFLDRVGKGIRTSPRDALIGDSVAAEHRGLAFSLHRAMDHTGAIVGPLAALALLQLLLGRTMWHGSASVPTPAEMRALRWLFALALFPGVGAMAVILWRVREAGARAPAARAEAGAAPAAARPLPGRFRAFVGIAALFALGNSSDLFIVFLGRARFGFSLVHLVGLWIALHVAKVAFSLPGGIISDRVGRRPVIVAGWLVYAAIYLGLAATRTAHGFVALVIAYGFYHGMTEGVEKALVADFAPPERRGTAFGIYHGAVGLAALPASLLFGVVWRLYGPALAFGLGATLAAVATLLLVLLLVSAGGVPASEDGR